MNDPTERQPPSVPQEIEDRDDLLDLFGLLRRQSRLIIGLALVTAAAAYALSQLQGPQYRATARVLYTDTAFGTTGIDPTRAVDTFVQLATTEDVLGPIARQLGFASTDALRRRVSVKADVNANIVAVTATSAAPDVAARHADVVATRLVSWRDATTINQTRARIRFYTSQLEALGGQDSAAALSAADDLRTQRAAARAQLAFPDPELRVVSKATAPRVKISPLPLRNALIGLVAGLILGLLVAAARDRLDQRVRDVSTLQRLYPWPVIGLVPVDKGLRRPALANFSGMSAVAAAYRTARTNLTLLDRASLERATKAIGRTDCRVYLVTSAGGGEGASRVVANLAGAFAGSGQRVLAVCADLLAPTLHAQFGLDGQRSRGLADVLSGETSLAEAVRSAHVAQLSKGGGTLSVLASARTFPDPAILFESRALCELLDVARMRYDIVLLQSSPLTVSADSALLAPLADHTVVVAGLETLERSDALWAAKTLRNLAIRPLGVVVTGDDRKRPTSASTSRVPEESAPLREPSKSQPQHA